MNAKAVLPTGLRTLAALIVALGMACGGGGGGTPAPAQTAPAFVLHPTNQTVVAGEPATFTAQASGNPAPAYQWERSGDGLTWAAVSGATQATFTFTAAAADNGARVRARASNGVGNTATSNSAELTVNRAPVFTLQPLGQTAVVGGTVTFTVAADGLPAPTFAWQKSVDGTTWTTLAGAAQANLAVLAQAGDHGLRFRALASNGIGNPVPSEAAVLSLAAVGVAVSPTPLTLEAGATQAFGATVTGAADTGVVWTVVEGAGAGTITPAGLYAAPFTPGVYHVRAVSVAVGTAFGEAAVTVVRPVATVGIDRSSLFTVNPGQSLQLQATVTGAVNHEVRWDFVDGGPGSVSATGLYTGPGTLLETAAPCRVRATSLADPSASDTVSIQLGLTAAADFYLAGAGDLALVFTGEANTLDPQVRSVSGLAAASVQLLYSGPGTAPVLGQDGMLRWTPDAAAAGLQDLTLRVQSSNGSTADLRLRVEGVTLTRVLSGTCGAEGGVVTSATGEFSMGLPPDALQGGFTMASLALDVAYRLDGTRIDRPSVTGVRADVEVARQFPPNPVAGSGLPPAEGGAVAALRTGTAARKRASQPDRIGPLSWKLVEPMGGTRWNAIAKRGSGGSPWLVTNQYFPEYKRYQWALGDNRVPTDWMAALYGELQFKMEFLEAGLLPATCQPVLFVHGYTPQAPPPTGGWEATFYGAGGSGTWGRAGDMVKQLGADHGLDVVCFEFLWQTAARFEDQAFNLSRAIKRIVQVTGKKPIVFAHSFGGVLANTYVLGLAEDINDVVHAGRRVPYGNDIAHLVTIGSPLSGIRWKRGDAESTPPLGMTLEDKLIYLLPIGRDDDDAVMGMGSQWTMYGAGGKPIGAFEDILAVDAQHKVTNPAGYARFQEATGFPMEPSGYTVGRIARAVKDLRDAGGTYPCPLTIMRGRRSPDDPALWALGPRDGDGLISSSGQLLRAEDASLPLAAGNFRFPGFGYRYFEMTTRDLYGFDPYDDLAAQRRREWFGFTHTALQASGFTVSGENGKYFSGLPADIQEDTYTEASNATEVRIRFIDKALSQGVAHGYALAVPGSYRAYGETRHVPHPLALIADDVLAKAAADNREVELNYNRVKCFGKATKNGAAPGALPLILEVKDTTPGGPGVIRRLAGTTGPDGAFAITFEEAFAAGSERPAERLQFDLAVGNDREVLVTPLSRISATLVDFGTFELTARPEVTATAAFAGIVRSPLGVLLAGATVQVKLGDGLSADAFRALQPFPQTPTSRTMVSSLTGEVAATGFIPGKYTALVTAAGFPETRLVITIPSSEASALQMNTGVSQIAVSPQAAVLVAETRQQFSTTVSLYGGANPTVVWSVLEPEGGTVSALGLYTAPASAGTYHLRAALASDPSIRADVAIQVTPGAPKVVSLAGGFIHSLALKSDGSVWAWGGNAIGQLGIGTTTDAPAPVQVPGLADVIAIAAGDYHSLALRRDGTVWAWGANYSGQFGDGTTTSSTLPVPTAGLTGVIAVTAGAYHSVALKADGTVWAWGEDAVGTVQVPFDILPLQVEGLTRIQAIAAKTGYTFALKDDATVWAWGSGGYGELGTGQVQATATPVQAGYYTGATALAPGNSFSLALKGDGTVLAVGNNTYGKLGDGTTTNALIPVQASGLSGVVAVSAGSMSSLALKGDGTVWAWGSNGLGQLGTGSGPDSSVPVLVPSLADIARISAGSRHCLALQRDGTVWSWGYNDHGQIGQPGQAVSWTPRVVDGL